MNGKSLFSDIGLFYAAAIWGSTFFIVKSSLKGIDATVLVGYRFMFAAAIMLVLLLSLKKKIFADFRHGFVLGLLLWILYISQTIGLNYTSASNSGFITGLFIIFLPIFSFIFFKIRPSLIKIATVFIAVFGLWLLTGELKQANPGDFLTLAAAMAYALHILFADKYMKKDIDPYTLSFQQFFTVGVLSFTLAFFTKAELSFSSLNSLYVVLFLTIFPTVSAFVIQLVAQKHTTPIKVGLIFTMEPVFAAIFAWSFGGEAFIFQKALGGLVIVFAMILAEIPLEKVFIKNEKQVK